MTVPAPLDDVLDRIALAAAAAGREASGITLTAVTKQQPWERIAPLVARGHRVFGENRVQEAQERWGGRREGLELRLIGPLQTNKVRETVALFDVIESLDRPRLAAALAVEIRRAGRTPRLLIQVNTGEEPSKAGVWPADADAFIALCRREHDLAVEGLMCIPPQLEPPGPHFALLAEIARRNDLAALSMGMSADFEVAIEFGATHVRVGSALFDARPAPP